MDDERDRINEYLARAASRYPDHIEMVDGGERTALSIDVHCDALSTDSGVMSLLVCVLKEVKRVSKDRGHRVGVSEVLIEGTGTYRDVVAVLDRVDA